MRLHLSGLKERSMLRGMHRFFCEVMHSTSPSSCSSRDTPNTFVPSILARTILAVVYHTAFVVFKFQFHSTGPRITAIQSPALPLAANRSYKLGECIIMLVGKTLHSKIHSYGWALQKAGNAAPGNTSPQECMRCLMFLNKRPATSD